MSETRKPNHKKQNGTPVSEPTNISRRGFLTGVGATVLLAGCFDSIILCRNDVDISNDGCSVSKASSMKPGDSLQAGGYKLVYTGASNNNAAFEIKDPKGNTLDTMVVGSGATRAVAPKQECTEYTLSVNSINADGTADAEVKTVC